MVAISTCLETSKETKVSASRWFGWITTLGQSPEDTQELKRQKSLLVLVTLLKASICAVLSVPLAVLGAYYAAAAPLFYLPATLLSVWFFSRSKCLKTFCTRQALFILLLPVGIHFGLGGFSSSGGVIIWSFLAPLISLLFEGHRQSLRWLLAFSLAIVLLGMTEGLGLLSGFALPWWIQPLFFVMNFVCVTGMAYVGVRYFGSLLEKEKESQAELNNQLKRANKHKSKFLASMSHKLLTPLNAIIGFTRIVKRRGQRLLPEKQIENLDKVLVSADRLLELNNEILDLAKIEAGYLELEKETFSLGSRLRTEVQVSETLARQGGTE